MWQAITSRLTWDSDLPVSKFTCVWPLTGARTEDYLVYHFPPEKTLGLYKCFQLQITQPIGVLGKYNMSSYKTSVGLAAPEVSHDIQGTATWESSLSWMTRKTAIQVPRHSPEKPANRRIEAELTSCWQAGVGASLGEVWDGVDVGCPSSSTCFICLSFQIRMPHRKQYLDSGAINNNSETWT